MISDARIRSSPAAKTRQRVRRTSEGTMKLAANLCAALLVLLAAQSDIRAIQLSEPAGENPGRFYARHGAGPCGAHSCRPVFGSLGHAVRGRERSRRRQQRRHRSRRQGGRRRHHAADGRQPVAGHQSEPVRKTAIRSDQGFCADLAGIHRGERARRSDRVAGQIRGGAGGVRQGAARQALLCPCRRRHVAASRRRIVQIHGAARYRSRCPIAAARR